LKNERRRQRLGSTLHIDLWRGFLRDTRLQSVKEGKTKHKKKPKKKQKKKKKKKTKKKKKKKQKNTKTTKNTNTPQKGARRKQQTKGKVR